MYVPEWQHFTSDSGEKLTLRGNPEPGVTPGSYDASGMRVCVYMYPEDFPAERIQAQIRDDLMQKGFLEGRNREECDGVVIPVDTITLPSGEKAYVLAEDICSYRQGPAVLAGREAYGGGAPLKGTYSMLRRMAETIADLNAAGYLLADFDAHQMFFDTWSGSFRFVMDGADITALQEGDTAQQNDLLSAFILFTLTGILPGRDDEWIRRFADELAADGWSVMRVDLPEMNFSDPEAEDSWKMFSPQLQDAFIHANTDRIGLIGPEEWEKILQGEEDAVYTCPHCGHEAAGGSAICVSCRESTSLEHDRVIFSVESETQPERFELTFGTGQMFCGCSLSPALKASPLFELVYNSSRNCLGLKNLGQLSWTVQTIDGDMQVMPGQIKTINESLETIHVSTRPAVTMTFAGYWKPRTDAQGPGGY